jgi:hypothetical protein
MKNVRSQSVKENMQLTTTKKDMLKDLNENLTKHDLIDFYIDGMANGKDKLKCLASDYGIKSSWANTAYEIGKKLMFKEINRVKRMRRDTPVRLEGAA